MLSFFIFILINEIFVKYSAEIKIEMMCFNLAVIAFK